MPRLLSGLLLIIIAAAASSCMKSPLLLPGLSLPAGSSVVNRTTGKNSASTQTALPGGLPIPTPPMGMGMGNGEYVMVMFNNTGGWSSVASHFDSQLKTKGYADTFQSLSQYMPPGGSAPGGMMQGMRMYSHPTQKYSVMLTDNIGMMAAAGGGASGLPGTGAFTLYVYHWK